MASSIDGIYAVSGGTTTPSASVAAQKSVAASAATSAATLHNPRVIQDPRAGFITQYLNSSGTEVVSQTPSAVTVAYLQQGLTPNGLPKKSVTTTA